MKKSIKITLIVVGVIALLFVLDIGSIFLRNKPIFAINSNCKCGYQKYLGLFYDTYNCEEYPVPQIKAKWTKFSCREFVNTTLIYGKITEINDNYIIITVLKSNSSIKINDEVHISLTNNPTINGANNLIVGQHVQIKPKSTEETYPIMITTEKIEIVDQSDMDSISTDKEKFMIGNTLSDGRLISFTFDVPYISEHSSARYLSEAFTNNLITIDETIKKLDLVDTYKDGGSKLYQYNKTTKTFGSENFYIMVCNSLDDIDDIFVAKNIESLNDKCTLKINDLDGVSMTIKDGTLTDIGATIIIKDTSDRDNIYGESYTLEKYEDNIWIKLTSINDVVFNDMGYHVNEKGILEMIVNWEYGYGKLSTGKYRIVKDTSETGEGTRHYITAEFIIK